MNRSMWSDKGEKQWNIDLKFIPGGESDQNDCIKVFTSTAPFPLLHVDDLLDASAWGGEGPKCLRVKSVEHAIVEKPALGIDPSGRQ